MAEERDHSETEEWISPIGQSFEDYVAEQCRLYPEYKKSWDESRPSRELAQVILVRRAELGLSQEELAERMGTSVAVISRLERVRQGFSVEMLRRLAEALDTKLVYSFETKGEQERAERDDRLFVVP